MSEWGYWCKKREYISNDFRVIVWNVSVRGGTQKTAQAACYWLYPWLYDFYLFVLLSLCLAMLDLFAPAAYHPCSSGAQSRISTSLHTGQHLVLLDWLGGLANQEQRCRLEERCCEALICTPVITYQSSIHTRGMQNRLNMLQLYRGWCWSINILISICRHDRACARRPVWACVTTHTCARGQPKALTPSTSSLPFVDDVTGKSDTMPRGKHTTSFIFPAFIPHTWRSV